MKLSSARRTVGMGLLSLSLAFVATPQQTFAQTALEPGVQYEEEDDFDWGWLGLLGLLGLFGLKRRDHDHRPPPRV